MRSHSIICSRSIFPGLHRDLEQRLYEGSLNATWKPHANLKWDLEGRTEPGARCFSN